MREYAKKSENQSHTRDSNPKASRQAPVNVILQRYKKQNIQRYAPEEDEELIQGKFDSSPVTEQDSTEQEEKPNNTGLPNNLKAGIENLSGYSMDDVKVHYNSDKPAQLQALAYTQGTDIHVAPGQEKHLPHEAWHVVQQKQGRVQPTMQFQGVNVNDSEGLEKEADVMGIKSIANIKGYKLLNLFDSVQHNNIETTQLYSETEANSLINNKFKKLKKWYNDIGIHAIKTIAAKSGKSFDEYLDSIQEKEFEDIITAIHKEYKNEISWFKYSEKELFINSKNYSNMKRVRRTNILVNSNIAETDENLQTFIKSYNSKKMHWFRGFSISHFSYNTFRESGVLSSEGTADNPTFTMGNKTPTRWLPGMYNSDIPKSIASSIDPADEGLRNLIETKIMPIGLVVKYSIIPPMPIAYLNDGEQVIRGPILGVNIQELILLGPEGYYEKNIINISDLPPTAPYNAKKGSDEIKQWEESIEEWKSINFIQSTVKIDQEEVTSDTES